MANLQSFDASGLCTGIDGPAQVGRYYQLPSSRSDNIAISYSGKYLMGTYENSLPQRGSLSNLCEINSAGVLTSLTVSNPPGGYTKNDVYATWFGDADKLLVYLTDIQSGVSYKTWVYDVATDTYTAMTALAHGLPTDFALGLFALALSATQMMLMITTAPASSGAKAVGMWTATAIGGAWTSRISVNSTAVDQQHYGVALMACSGNYIAAWEKGAGEIVYRSASLTGAYSAVAMGNYTLSGISPTEMRTSEYGLTNSYIAVRNSVDGKYYFTNNFSGYTDSGLYDLASLGGGNLWLVGESYSYEVRYYNGTAYDYNYSKINKLASDILDGLNLSYVNGKVMLALIHRNSDILVLHESGRIA